MFKIPNRSDLDGVVLKKTTRPWEIVPSVMNAAPVVIMLERIQLLLQRTWYDNLRAFYATMALKPLPRPTFEAKKLPEPKAPPHGHKRLKGKPRGRHYPALSRRAASPWGAFSTPTD